LEDVSADRDAQRQNLRAVLQPLRTSLKQQQYIGGECPSFADYVVFAALQWPRCGTGRHLLDEDDPVYAWFERLARMYDGLGVNAPCAEPLVRP
jgi:glutathione S-transferase